MASEISKAYSRQWNEFYTNPLIRQKSKGFNEIPSKKYPRKKRIEGEELISVDGEPPFVVV